MSEWLRNNAPEHLNTAFQFMMQSVTVRDRDPGFVCLLRRVPFLLLTPPFSHTQVKPVRHTVCMAIASVSQQCFDVMGPFLDGLMEVGLRVSRVCW